MTSSLRDLKVCTTYPHSCSYLEDQEATTLFVDPRTTVDSTLYSKLSVLGFRRSGSHLYRPHCGHCNACIPARVPVARYQANRSQRRACGRDRGGSKKTAARDHFVSPGEFLLVPWVLRDPGSGVPSSNRSSMNLAKSGEYAR